MYIIVKILKLFIVVIKVFQSLNFLTGLHDNIPQGQTMHEVFFSKKMINSPKKRKLKDH